MVAGGVVVVVGKCGGVCAARQMSLQPTGQACLSPPGRQEPPNLHPVPKVPAREGRQGVVCKAKAKGVAGRCGDR